MLFKKKGFTLIETLVTMVIFTIVLVASGKILTTMLKLQTESNIQLIIVDVLQSRLQEAAIVPTGADVCDGVDQAQITIKDTGYFVYCAKDKIEKDGIVIEWPVLGASEVETQAEECAKGISSNDCFVIGR